MMERPTKRPRFSHSIEEGPLLDDQAVQEARARNDQRLKSRFECIFEKYGRDFSDVGDEIDLRTGKIVVNNGHVLHMQREGGLGSKTDLLLTADGHISPGPGCLDSSTNSAATAFGYIPDENRLNLRTLLEPHSPMQEKMLSSLKAEVSMAPTVVESLGTDSDTSSVDSLLAAALSLGTYHVDQCRDPPNGPKEPTSHFISKRTSPSHSVTCQPQNYYTKGGSIEPMWQVPDIDDKFITPKFNKTTPITPVSLARMRSVSPPGLGSLWTLSTPRCKDNTDVVKRARKFVPTGQKGKQKLNQDWSFSKHRDDSESDDPLQEVFRSSPAPKSASNTKTGNNLPAISSLPIGLAGSVCESCGEYFSGPDFLSHLDSILYRNQLDDLHNLESVKKQRDSIKFLAGSPLPIRRVSPKRGYTTEYQETSSSSPEATSVVIGIGTY